MIEGIDFVASKCSIQGAKHSRVVTKSGTHVSVIFCPNVLEDVEGMKMRRCLHDTIEHKPFEIAIGVERPIPEWEVKGFLTAKEVVSVLIEFGGVEYD